MMKKIEASNFKRLIGTWKTSGLVITQEKTVDLNGVDTYALILDGNFIRHKADVMMGMEKSETFEMISLGHSDDDAKMQYFNSRGESGVMTSQMKNDSFQINGNGIKFQGLINEENSEIIGNRSIQSENKEWIEFIELKLEKLF